MDGTGVALALGALKVLAFVYDFLTYPVYLILQRPWNVRALARKVQVSLAILAVEKMGPVSS